MLLSMAGQQGLVSRVLKRIHPYARALGLGRGVMVRHRRARVCQPTALLELFSFEACGHCRRVREALTELDLDYVHRSCPVGDDRNRTVLAQRGGRVRVPYLVDPNTGVELYEASAIVGYLESVYG